MTYQFLEVSTVNQIATISLNRTEKRNALNREMLTELRKAFAEIEQMNDTVALVLRAKGNHFCAGADINWMQKIAASTPNENYEDAAYLEQFMYTLYHFPKPTIVVVHGAAMGGGLGMIAACDMAIASEDAYFAFSEVKIGIAPSTISPYVLAAIGERAARYYFLTGEKFTASIALELGLLQQVVPGAKLDEVLTNITDLLCKNSPNAMRNIKELICLVAHKPINNELGQITARHLANLRSSPDAKEGLLSFSEKRPPVWHKEK